MYWKSMKRDSYYCYLLVQGETVNLLNRNGLNGNLKNDTKWED